MSTEPVTSGSALTIGKFNGALHDRSAFSCGRASIDRLLKERLSARVRDGMLTVFVATLGDDPAVLGFYGLCAHVLKGGLGPRKWSRTRMLDTPASYIQAIGIREDMQGKGLGTALVHHAMKRCLRGADEIGSAAIVLDVLDGEGLERRRKFYSDLGFRSLEDLENPLRMYIQMSDVRNTLV